MWRCGFRFLTLICRVPKDFDNKPVYLKQGALCLGVIGSRVTLYSCGTEGVKGQVSKRDGPG